MIDDVLLLVARPRLAVVVGELARPVFAPLLAGARKSDEGGKGVLAVRCRLVSNRTLAA